MQSQKKESHLAAGLIGEGFTEGEDPAGALVGEPFHRRARGRAARGRGLIFTESFLPSAVASTLYTSNSFNFHQAPTRSDFFPQSTNHNSK